jgi:hypothetical protein
MRLVPPILALAFLLPLALAGCADNDTPTTDDPRVGRTPNPWTSDMLPDPVTGVEFVKNADSDRTTGIFLHDDYAYLSGSSGLRIYDVVDPVGSFLVAGDVAGTEGTRDVDIMEHPNGRIYAVMAHGGAKISITDVTDATAPEHVLDVTNIGAAHNIAVVPGAPIIYNSRSISQHVPSPGFFGQIDIVDLTDLTAPAVTTFHMPAVILAAGGVPKPLTATTCHDITFLNTEEKTWAYCAGVTETQIWDISTPLEPVVLQVVQTPLNQIHHGAWGARGGDILIIGDEFAGALAGTTCTDPAPNPYAALWFWDVSDLATPLPLGFYSISYNSATAQDAELCTTHFGSLVEDRDLFVIGWYTAGVAFVDFSDAMNPKEVGRYHSDGAQSVWDARYYKGYVYTGDTQRGMDLLRVV